MGRGASTPRGLQENKVASLTKKDQSFNALDAEK